LKGYFSATVFSIVGGIKFVVIKIVDYLGKGLDNPTTMGCFGLVGIRLPISAEAWGDTNSKRDINVF
jgi:hypothetical protein